MKTKKLIILAIGISSLATVASVAGPVIVVQPPSPPVVVVRPPSPPPAVTVQIGVPDSYVWDGYEYVGVVGDQYYYLGSGNVWVACDAARLARFHDWTKVHADWRVHATVNKDYRLDAHGHNHPWQDKHGH